MFNLRMGLMGTPMGGQYGYDMSNPSSYKLASGGGMDVMGTLKANSDFATQWMNNPTSGQTNAFGSGGGFLSNLFGGGQSPGNYND